MSIATYVLLGLVGGGCLIAFARRQRDGGRRVFGVGLIVVALIYMGFALRSDPLSTWLLIETGGVTLYGLFAVLGIKGSHWWLAAGWALHPVWDLALHYFGTGAAFTPTGYAIVCVSFDLLIAGYVAYAFSGKPLSSRKA